MGFNTVAVLYNDMSSEFRNSGPLGRRISEAMNAWTRRDRDSMATDFGAGKVVSQAHADSSQIVVVSRNSGSPLEDCETLDWAALDQLEHALVRHGYIVKKSKSRTA